MNYEKIYNQIINRAKDRVLVGYKEKHHILPKCLGGTNDNSNLVPLTAREHFICHMLLTEIYPREKKLKFAIWAMSTLKGKTRKRYKISSKTYERIRREVSFFKSENQRGVPRLETSLKLKGKKHSEERKEKIKNAHWSKGPNAEQIKQKLKEARTGKKINKETIEKIKSSKKGFKHTEETKNKIRESNKPSREFLKKINGYVVSEETREKLRRAAKLKNPVSEETRKKISQSKTGKLRSEETKKKISESHKGKTPWNKGLKYSHKKQHQEV